MAKEISEDYGVELDEDLKDTLSNIIDDEETHRHLLGEIKKILDERAQPKIKHPLVEYRNPDAWNRPQSTSNENQ
jgi:rubrerythrin